MSFNNIKDTSGSPTELRTGVLHQIHVDGVHTKVLPTGYAPSVVYRIGDGTGPYGPDNWDNVLNQRYIDFYMPNGTSTSTTTTDTAKWIEEKTAIEGQTVFTYSRDLGNASLYLNGALLSITDFSVVEATVTLYISTSVGDSLTAVGGESSSTATIGGQFLGQGANKGVQYMAQNSIADDYILVQDGYNAFSVDSFTLENGAELIVNDGGVYKVL